MIFFKKQCSIFLKENYKVESQWQDLLSIHKPNQTKENKIIKMCCTNFLKYSFVYHFRWDSFIFCFLLLASSFTKKWRRHCSVFSGTKKNSYFISSFMAIFVVVLVPCASVIRKVNKWWPKDILDSLMWILQMAQRHICLEMFNGSYTCWRYRRPYHKWILPKW